MKPPAKDAQEAPPMPLDELARRMLSMPPQPKKKAPKKPEGDKDPKPSSA